MTISERADALEEIMSRHLDEQMAVKSVLFVSGDIEPKDIGTPPLSRGAKHYLMGDDPRLSKMPAKPMLADFFTHRFMPPNHLLQSATHALHAGQSEKVIMACLLHDIAVIGFIRGDHGYWGAQLVEPYVDEEITWAIRAHQALRFYADEAAGYAYPEAYVRFFGDAYTPEPYIQAAYKEALKNKWYGTSRAITVHDIYSFDPDAVVNFDDFRDIIARNFKQPEEGLGFDSSPVAHMWRTMIRPTRFL
jgi:hypothetical protein